MSIKSVFPLIGSKPKGSSAAEYFGPCPRCKGTDRFITWPETGRFWCRKCNWHGDEIQFLMDTEGLSYPKACELLGIIPKDKSSKKETTRTSSSNEWTPKPSVLPNDMWIAQATLLVSQCSKCISQDKQGMDYALSRGLSLDAIETYNIGWNSFDLYLPREDWGFEPEPNSHTGRQRRQFVSKGLIIPTIIDGSVVDIKVRRYPWNELDGMGKLLVVSGSSMAPLTLPGGKVMVVVESELDALLVAQEALTIATPIALRSASNRPDIETTKLLRESKLILVATDHDEAGSIAWFWWQKNFPNAFRWPVSVGKDVGDMVQEGEPVKDWILDGVRSFIDYKNLKL